MEGCRVPLPRSVRAPFEVFVNGVPQQAGSDYELRDGALLFARELVQEGKLGAWRWFLGAWGIGSYGRNDVIDVRYTLNGHPQVAHGLAVERPDLPPAAPASGSTA
jgi:hypothetical protein